MSKLSRLKQRPTIGWERRPRREQGPHVEYLGSYRLTKESRGGYMRAFGPGTIIKASDRQYLVTPQGNFLRGSISLADGKFHHEKRTRNHERRAA